MRFSSLRSRPSLPIVALAAVSFAVTASSPLLADEGGHPNIVLIMADDVGYECFGCYGSEQYETPHIDRLAQEGIRFQQAHSQPLCTPTRVKIMTGLSNVRNYAAFSILRKDQTTFAHRLQDAGYRTAVGGKWQLYGAEHYPERFRAKGTLPGEAGFDRHILWQVTERPSRYWKPVLTVDGELEEFGKDEYGPDVVTDSLLDFMETEHGEGPFFVYYPMILVHSPFKPTPGSDSRDARDRQQNFEDMVTHMDEIVGRFASKAEELGIAEETLIVFTGDNGTHKRITSHLKGRTIEGGKSQPTDAGTRVPMVAHWPGTIEPGQVSDRLISFSDFVPTLQELAGEPVPDGLDGVSFAPLLKGEDMPERGPMFCYYNPRPERTEPVRFARTGEWKLYADGDFFHVAEDPTESESLPASANPEVHATLEQKIESMPAEGRMLLEYE